MTSSPDGCRAVYKACATHRGDRIPFRDVADRTRVVPPGHGRRCVDRGGEVALGAAQELGHEVRTVAGEGICDVTVRGLELAATSPPDPDELDERARGRRAASSSRTSAPSRSTRRRPGPSRRCSRGAPAVLHHHDLPWQRPQFRHHEGPPTDPAWRHVTINERSCDELADRGIAATVIPNHFDLDPPPGDRAAMRAAIGVRPGAILVVHPVRAIPRKNVGGALRFAEHMGAVYWLVGGAEDGFGPELDRLLLGRAHRHAARRPRGLRHGGRLRGERRGRAVVDLGGLRERRDRVRRVPQAARTALVPRHGGDRAPRAALLRPRRGRRAPQRSWSVPTRPCSTPTSPRRGRPTTCRCCPGASRRCCTDSSEGAPVGSLALW